MDFQNMNFHDMFENINSKSTLLLKNYFDFVERLKNKSIKISNSKFNELIQKYSFCHMTTKWNSEDNPQICQNFRDSQVVVINQFEIGNQDDKELFFMLAFNKTVVVISYIIAYVLNNLFSYNENIIICYLSGSEQTFKGRTIYCFNKILPDSYIIREISDFNSQIFFIGKNFSSFVTISGLIQTSISHYLLLSAHIKVNQNRYMKFLMQKNQKITPETMKENEYIEILDIGSGYTSNIKLIYHIEKGEIFALKKPHLNDSETNDLVKREIDNYSRINHPFFPKLFGIIQEKNYIIIEFVNGKTLNDMIIAPLSEKEKFTFIFQLMLTIEYLHQNDLIYRDLKPNNIMIDQDKNVVLIDFDRMIYKENISNRKRFTCDFSSSFHAPEINTVSISESCDTYSLGKIIYYIINEKIPDFGDSLTSLGNLDEYLDLKNLYLQCIKQNPDERISLKSLIIQFYLAYYSKIDIGDLFDIYLDCLTKMYDEETIKIMIQISFDINNPEVLFNIGAIYEEGEYFPCNIEMAIRYYELAASLGERRAQCNLGIIYQTGPSLIRNEEKAIYYYSLAANRNCVRSQINLGIIYSERNDFKNAKKYYTMAAQQNQPTANYLLGYIYFQENDFEKAKYYLSMIKDTNNYNADYLLAYIYLLDNEYSAKNINKLMKYFSYAAKMGIVKANYILGYIYYKGYHVTPDINKSLYYYQLAADKNDTDAQYALGIHYFNNDLRNNIDKCIFYFTKAANQNCAHAQLALGYIYYDGNFTVRDIYKSIHYFELAEKNNLPEAQYFLGNIYKNGIYISQDIGKAFYYYFQSAEKNYGDSQYELGYFYHTGKYVPKNINKAIHYYKLAAAQNNSNAYYMLGLIYSRENCVHHNIKKAIYYYTQSADLNNSYAQFDLGFIYFQNSLIEQNVDKAIKLFIQAAENRNYNAFFVVAVLYHEGIYIKKDISKSIYFYKEASSLNNQYAKNNLAIIFKNGIENEIEPNIELAIEYLKEAIKQKKDQLAMYNLANIYFYQGSIEKSMNLLIDLFKSGFVDSLQLFCIVIVKKIGFNFSFQLFEQELLDLDCFTSEQVLSLFEIIKTLNLDDEKIFEGMYQYHQKIDYLYDQFKNVNSTKEFEKKHNEIKKSKCIKTRDISSDFYDGFGINLDD